ncbi:hypothetical protein MYSI104531_27205 [Mycobacterium simiae]
MNSEAAHRNPFGCAHLGKDRVTAAPKGAQTTKCRSIVVAAGRQHLIDVTHVGRSGPDGRPYRQVRAWFVLRRA